MEDGLKLAPEYDTEILTFSERGSFVTKGLSLQTLVMMGHSLR